MQVVFSKTCKGSQADLVLSSHWLMLMCESTNALTVILKMASVQCWLSDKRSSVNYCTARDWHFKCFSKHQERKKKPKKKTQKWKNSLSLANHFIKVPSSNSQRVEQGYNLLLLKAKRRECGDTKQAFTYGFVMHWPLQQEINWHHVDSARLKSESKKMELKIPSFSGTKIRTV